MRRLAIWLIVLLVVLASVTSMDKCLKNAAFARTGVITTVTCDTAPCNCCNGCCTHTTATYIGVQPGHEHDGLWLTSSHAVGGGTTTTIWVDGRVADYVSGACVIAKGAVCAGCPGDVGYAMLKTTGYVPCGACPAQPSFDICCGEELYFVDVRKCRTVTKCHIIDCCDSTLFKTDTLPDCENCGAVAYDYCGRMIGILVGGRKGCRPDGCKERCTIFLPLTPDMFRCLEPEQPEDAVASAPPAV